MKWKKRLLAGLIFVLAAATTTLATDTLTTPKPEPTIKTFFLLQLWSSYTTNEQVFDPEQQSYRPVEDRYNIWFRRAIVGFKAQPYANLQFKLLTAFDGIGKDLFSGANGSFNNGALPKIGILEAYAQWQCWPETEAFHVVAGYFRPQIGRESINSSWEITSMDRPLGYAYLRKHLTGSAFGRTAGVQLGGLLSYPEQGFGFEYGLGLFNPQFAGPEGSSSENYSPLLTARGAVTFGDPEMDSYRVFRKVNYLSRRRGLTLAANAARQGPTDLFNGSSTLSADLLLNWGALNFDAEYAYLHREGRRSPAEEAERDFSSTSSTGHLRLSYNFQVGGYILEPSATYMFFQGVLDETAQADALAIGASAGRDRGVDVGFNWYVRDNNCKILLHYTWRWGDAGAAGDGATVNYYFSQSGLGAIRRGNWLGLGVNWKF